MPLHVELVSPEEISYSGEADMVIVRTVGGGDIAFQPGHVPFIGVLDIWEARVIGADREDRFAVHSGFVQVAHDKVTILSDVSEAAHAIDVDRARRAKQAAEGGLQASRDDHDAAAALRRAEVRLEVAAVAAG